MLTPNSNGWYTTRTIRVHLDQHDYIVHLNKGHIEDGWDDDEREENIECVHMIDCEGYGIIYDFMREDDAEFPDPEVERIMEHLNYGQLDSGAFSPELGYGEIEGH